MGLQLAGKFLLEFLVGSELVIGGFCVALEEFRGIVARGAVPSRR